MQILDCHQEQTKHSQWKRCSVRSLKVLPLDGESPLSDDISAFAEGTTQDAIDDTVLGLGLAIQVDGKLYPVRDTAYKSLLDRAKIGGSVLPKLSRKTLADVLNECLHMFTSDALVLIRDEKVSAVHSGDVRDYSILPIDELLSVLKKKLDERFPGWNFENGYRDHSVTSVTFTFPLQREELKVFGRQRAKEYSRQARSRYQVYYLGYGCCVGKGVGNGYGQTNTDSHRRLYRGGP